MATALTVECNGAAPVSARYIGEAWRVVSPGEAASVTAVWRARAAQSPRDWEVHLYEVSDATSVPPGGVAGLLVGGGDTACADLGPRVWFAELRRVEYIGWRSEGRIAWAPTVQQIEALENQPGATEGGWYVERMAPRWAEAAKNTLAQGAGGLLGGLANFVGEVFGKAALAFLQTIGPWALVLLAGWIAVKVVT